MGRAHGGRERAYRHGQPAVSGMMDEHMMTRQLNSAVLTVHSIPLNDARFDRSGKRVTLATDSGAIKVTCTQAA